jgi:predicted DNA-binding transcriptional regulator AlpA
MSSSTTIPEAGPELLTLPQVAALCGVSQRTLWGWAVAGISPPPLKIGKGTVRYSRRAYADWVSRGCAPCNGGQPNDS